MTTLTDFLDGGRGAALTRADLDALKRREQPRVVVVRGSRMGTKAELLNEVSAALQFPLDFGGNWDALADCLSDLGWLGGASSVVLAIAQVEQVLARESDAFDTFVEVLNDRASRVLLATAKPGTADAVRAAWRTAGLTVQELA